jgi:hypothetical protein
MTSGFSEEITGGLGSLRIPQIQSPNFVHNSLGWTINQDGSAEFNNLSIRGTFNGTDFVINSLGAFFYSGTPASGNLIASIVNQAGSNDGVGNAYQAGFTTYATGPTSWVSIFAGQVSFQAPTSLANGIISDSGQGSMGFQSSLSATVGDITAAMQLLSSKETQGGVAPELIVFNDVQVQGVVRAENPVLLANTDEGWHAFALSSGDYTQFGEVPSFRLDPDGMVSIKGIIQFNAGAAVGLSGNNSFTNAILPAYWPSVAKNMWAYMNGGSGTPTLSANTTPFVQMSAAGVLSLHNVNSANVLNAKAFFGFSGRYSLTNP